VTDWSDGRIDGTYPMGCYRQALQAMPEDIRLYSSAVDDIQRALARRVRATSRTLAGGFVARRSAAPNTPVTGSSGPDSIAPPLLLGGSLALLVALLAGATLVIRGKLPSKRMR